MISNGLPFELRKTNILYRNTLKVVVQEELEKFGTFGTPEILYVVQFYFNSLAVETKLSVTPSQPVGTSLCVRYGCERYTFHVTSHVAICCPSPVCSRHPVWPWGKWAKWNKRENIIKLVANDLCQQAVTCTSLCDCSGILVLRYDGIISLKLDNVP